MQCIVSRKRTRYIQAKRGELTPALALPHHCAFRLALSAKQRFADSEERFPGKTEIGSHVMEPALRSEERSHCSLAELGVSPFITQG